MDSWHDNCIYICRCKCIEIFFWSIIVNRVLVNNLTASFVSGIDELRTEFFRKSIHMLIAVVPLLASYDRGLALALLGSGAIIYSYTELLRVQGLSVALISGIKELALREKDRKRFATGPVTLALGAMAALLFYPAEVAKIAIYALAFGDGFASIVGKLFGRTKIPFTGGKSLEGSFACFLAVYISSYYVTNNVSSSIVMAVSVAAVEALPLGDFDNFVIPVFAGYLAVFLF